MSENSCVFCELSKNKERIVAETNLFVVMATLGQISDGGYVLIVPKRHVACLAELNKKEMDEFNYLLWEKTRPVIYKEYHPNCILGFEHGIVGQTVKHAHYHLIPGVHGISKRILEEFPGEFVNGEFIGLQQKYTAKPQPYLFVDEPENTTMQVFWNPLAPPMYLRLIAAQVIGRPERGDWKKMDPNLDRKLWSETVTRLRPYFS